jgi:hypothetical protein
MKWESRKLTSSQFAKIHSDFMVAALDYVSNARDRYIPLMSEKMLTMHLDAIVYPLVYENQTEEFELLVYHVPDHGDKKRPMFEWIQRLQILAEESFHKPFVTK